MTEPYRYAASTSVPVERSKQEIERLLRRHGATAFAAMWSGERYVVMFEMRSRRVRLDVPAPDRKKFRTDSKYDQEQRRRWRVLLLLLKSKLEMVASGDADFDAEFLAYLSLPGDATVASRVLPALDELLKNGKMPPLLPGAP